MASRWPETTLPWWHASTSGIGRSLCPDSHAIMTFGTINRSFFLVIRVRTIKTISFPKLLPFVCSFKTFPSLENENSEFHDFSRISLNPDKQSSLLLFTGLSENPQKTMRVWTAQTALKGLRRDALAHLARCASPSVRPLLQSLVILAFGRWRMCKARRETERIPY